MRRTSPCTRIIGGRPADRCRSEALFLTEKASNSEMSIYNSCAAKYAPSFPRRREPKLGWHARNLDPRLRGGDGGVAQTENISYRKPLCPQSPPTCKLSKRQSRLPAALRQGRAPPSS